MRPTIIRRARRWGRRTRWMLGAVAHDLGLGDDRPPIWRRDNPFWGKTAHTDARRYLLAGRLLLTTLTLAGLLVGGLFVRTAYPQFVHGLLRVFRSPLNWPGWLFVTVSFFHLLLILSARQAFATQIHLEAQRQTLPMLLLTPLRRAEMLWAMAVPAAAAALVMALAGLPIYVLLREFGGCEWRDIALLYVVFALTAFDPPAYARPALSPDPPPVVSNARAARGTRGSSGGVSYLPLFAFLAWTFGTLLRGMGGWGLHLLAVLPPPVPELMMILFAWPFGVGLLLAAPLPFFGGHLPPFWYVVPLLMAGWVTSALRTGAALAAGDESDLARLPLSRRARTLGRWASRLGWFCLLAFTWRPWVLGGDLAGLLGVSVPSLADDLAGLLLVLGSLAAFRAGGAALGAVNARKDSHVLRPLPRVLRKVVRRAGRPLRLGLLLFALLCLCGGASPFAPPVYAVLGRLALVALAMVAGAAGYAAVGLRWSGRGRDEANRAARRTQVAQALLLLPLGVPFAALSVPSLAPLAALSPLTALIELFPGADVPIHAFPPWPLGPLPPFSVAVGVPVALAVLELAWAYRPSRVPAPAVPPLPTAPRPSPETTPAKRAPRYPQRTAALIAWLTVRTDNPLFLYEMRTRTRDGLWFRWLQIVGVLFLVVLFAAPSYPDFVGAFSFMAVLNFFRHGLVLLSTPTPPQVYGLLAADLFSLELYALALRGQTIGEALFWKDQERGTLGALLLTPLTAGQVFWGKVWGQTAGCVVAWGVCGIAGLALYLLESPETGLGPALRAWGLSQLFIAAAFVLSVGLGTAAATHTLRRKSLRGLSTWLLLVAYGAGFRYLVWPDLFAPTPAAPTPLAHYLVSGTLLALALAVLAFVYARWRVAALRRGDMVFGEGGAA